MYTKKTTGYVVSAQDGGGGRLEKSFDSQPYRVFKTGRVLTLREEGSVRLQKNADIASIANKGLDYYQVISNQGACEKCQEHNGAIYLVANAKEGDTLPPFHPNCKCTIREFSVNNPNHDPWTQETIFWLDIMYGDGSMEQKAQKVLDFYSWTEFSVEFITGALSAVADITHIGKRMQAFFNYLENPSAVAIITPADLQEFGWHTATQDEAARLMAAFAKFGITSRESMIQFMAIAMAESKGGKSNLEGERMSDEAFIRYLKDNGLNYGINERGAGYIQITYRKTHLAFLKYVGDDFDGEDTARYIAENYPLEASMWFWAINNTYGWQGVNEFIQTKTDEGGDLLLVFLKTAYYVAGMPRGNFNDDINDAISGKASYTITDTHLIINGNRYLLPDRWDVRLEAYEKAQEIW